MKAKPIEGLAFLHQQYLLTLFNSNLFSLWIRFGLKLLLLFNVKLKNLLFKLNKTYLFYFT